MAIANADESQVGLRSYVVLFVILYLFATVVVTAIEYAFDLVAYAGTSIGIVFASAIMPVRRFVLDHHRPFSRREQCRFALLALIASAVVDLTLIVLVILFAGGLDDLLFLVDELGWNPEEEWPVMAIAVIVGYFVLFALLYFLTGVASRFFQQNACREGQDLTRPPSRQKLLETCDEETRRHFDLWPWLKHGVADRSRPSPRLPGRDCVRAF